MFRYSVLSAAVLLALAAPAPAQTTPAASQPAPAMGPNTWTIDSNHSAAQFSVRHMLVSTVRGNLGKITGTVEFDGKNIGGIVVNSTIDATAIDTRVEPRDADLRSTSFFDVATYPTITFKSKRAEPAGEGRFRLFGDLTMHGVTKEVVLDVEGPSPSIKQRDTERAGAFATTKLNRKDFGLNWNKLLETGGAVVSDDVSVTLDLELTRKVAAAQ